MSDNRTSHWQQSVRIRSGRLAVRGGFSVCLFVVVLAVFGWVMHRRLTQYDSPPQTIHQSTALKVCPTKRNPISVPSMPGIDAVAVFFLSFAFVAMGGSLENPKASVAFRVQRDREVCSPVRTRPNLVHFFFLPPPSQSPVL